MVFYFTSNVVSPAVTLFMGADKHESEYPLLKIVNHQPREKALTPQETAAAVAGK